MAALRGSLDAPVKYRYCIDHPTVRIGLTASRHLPPVRIQPRIQHPTLRHQAPGVERPRAAKWAGSIRKLLPAITGYLAAYGALAGTNDIDDTLTTLGQPLRDYETIR